VTRHLLELGHTRIAYIGNKYSGRSNLDRLAGFRAEMEAAGLSASDQYIYDAPGNGPGNGLPAVQHFLGYDEQPSAYVCYNDMIAIGVLKGLQQHGILVPEQVSVAGFDNITFSAYTNPPLTTFDQPKRFIGAEAARLMLDLLLCSDPADLSQHSVRVLKGRLLPRESTGPFNPRQR
jgi:LacI family repressor for deo operon, udp, cdd, tsx, nupC, and nupG